MTVLRGLTYISGTPWSTDLKLFENFIKVILKQKFDFHMSPPTLGYHKNTQIWRMFLGTKNRLKMLIIVSLENEFVSGDSSLYFKRFWEGEQELSREHTVSLPSVFVAPKIWSPQKSGCDWVNIWRAPRYGTYLLSDISGNDEEENMKSQKLSKNEYHRR